jgi:hypothetical protein
MDSTPNRHLSEGNLGDLAAQQQIGKLHTHIQTLTANEPCAHPLKINSPKEFSGARLEA